MENVLYHHGIKGQKWGVRRYENEDGTLTPAGKKRYQKGGFGSAATDEEKQSYIKSVSLDRSYKKAVAENSGTQRTKDIVDASTQLVREAKKISDEGLKNRKVKQKLDLSNMTDKEMRDRINRQLLENQYNQMFAPEVDTTKNGERVVNKCLEYGMAGLTVTSSALAIALSIKKLKG